MHHALDALQLYLALQVLVRVCAGPHGGRGHRVELRSLSCRDGHRICIGPPAKQLTENRPGPGVLHGRTKIAGRSNAGPLWLDTQGMGATFEHMVTDAVYAVTHLGTAATRHRVEFTRYGERIEVCLGAYRGTLRWYPEEDRVSWLVPMHMPPSPELDAMYEALGDLADSVRTLQARPDNVRALTEVESRLGDVQLQLASAPFYIDEAAKAGWEMVREALQTLPAWTRRNEVSGLRPLPGS